MRFLTTWQRKTGRSLSGRAVLACALLAQAVPALANGQFEIDADGDGRYSIQELRVHYPSLTIAGFNQIDINHDGVVSPSEFRAGQDDGLLVHPVDWQTGFLSYPACPQDCASGLSGGFPRA